MKELLAVLPLLIAAVVAEAPGPYAPSGWRPSGPSFDLPQRTPLDPRNRTPQPQKQEYLPPAVPRTPDQEYGPPEVDVSVQGLPTREQLPIFQLSPVNGQQYVGPNFNADLKGLEEQQRQLQAQQNIYREFERQRQLEAAYARANANRPQPAPRQFVPSTTTTLRPDDFKTTLPESTTEALNQGEVLDDKEKKDKVTVEVSKQTIQEYRPELYLASLAQLQLQNQFSPVQLGQLRAPIFLEPAQRQVAYNAPAQFSASPEVLAQQQLYQAQLAQVQLAEAQLAQAQLAQAQLGQGQVQPQPQFVQTQPQQTQQGIAPGPAYFIPQDQAAFIPQTAQAQPELQVQQQYQPANQYDVQAAQNYPQQYSQQPLFLQPQQNQLLPRPQDQQVTEQDQTQQVQPQFAYQYQPSYQQEYQQPQYRQPLNSYQQALLQPQLFVQDPAYQQQDQYQQQRVPGQGSLQSGLDVNQQGNGIDQPEDKEEVEDNGTTATAVATAFGTRTQPRTTYGAPVPRVQASPGYQYPTTTEPANQDAATEDGSGVEAVARSRRPAKLRTRQGRVRPVFTLDRSGHLVLAHDQ